MSWLADYFGLEGRTAVVTGGGSGLGRSIAIALADAGANVCVWDLDGSHAAGTQALIEESAGRPAHGLVVDVTNEGSVAAGLESTLARWPAVDILVNSAGISHNDAATDISSETWQRVIDINLTGSMLCCQIVGRHMVERKSGSIINMASIMAIVAVSNKVAYNASKGAVAQMTKSLAVEWAEHNVRVNALAPAPFESPMFEYATSANPDLFKFMWTVSPFGRPGRPEEIMGPAVFLASDASSMVTGHVLAVDGGYLAH